LAQHWHIWPFGFFTGTQGPLLGAFTTVTEALLKFDGDNGARQQLSDRPDIIAQVFNEKNQSWPFWFDIWIGLYNGIPKKGLATYSFADLSSSPL
jgi:hypothetical protein